MQLGDRVRKLIMMQDVALWNAAKSLGKLVGLGKVPPCVGSPWCLEDLETGPFPGLTLIKNQKGVLFARCGPTAGVSVLSVARYNLIS